MVILLADENFKDQILDGLVRRHPRLEIVKAKDVGLLSTSDDVVLAWAAEQIRFVLTHDKNTMVPEANRRLRLNLPFPGLAYVPWDLGIGRAIDDLELLLIGSPEEELLAQVHYLPIRPRR